MLLGSPSRNIPLWPRLRRTQGWIGLDAGAALIKLAQVKRTKTGYQIAARWTIELDGEAEQIPDNASGILTSALPQLTAARRMFRGRDTAATLSLSNMDLRTLDLPFGNEDETEAMIREELQTEQEGIGDDLSFRFWQTGRPSPGAQNSAQVSVVTVRKRLAQQFSDAAHAAGYDCGLLDGPPCALARAAALDASARQGVPTAIIDLGTSAATFVLAIDGCPYFVRQLRDCGLGAFLKTLQDRLGLAPAEARHVLFRYGVLTKESDQGPGLATQQLIAEPLGNLLAEIQRTLMFLDQRFRSSIPQGLILLGGGALMPGLTRLIGAETGIATRLWSMDSNPNAAALDALFGVAAALSTLAWEDASCM